MDRENLMKKPEPISELSARLISKNIRCIAISVKSGDAHEFVRTLSEFGDLHVVDKEKYRLFVDDNYSLDEVFLYITAYVR